MFIPEFWCGVAATILAEIALVIAAGIWKRGMGGKH